MAEAITELEKFLEQDVIPIIQDQFYIVNQNSREQMMIRFLDTVNRFLNIMIRFRNYLNFWSGKITFPRYYERRRRDYHDESEELRLRFNQFENARQIEEEQRQSRVRDKIQEIESREIRNIFGREVLETI